MKLNLEPSLDLTRPIFGVNAIYVPKSYFADNGYSLHCAELRKLNYHATLRVETISCGVTVYTVAYNWMPRKAIKVYGQD